MRIEPFLAERLHIVDTLEDGRGLARLETPGGSRVVFVDGGVPGDLADVWVYGTQKRALTGRVQSLTTPSPERAMPLCRHFADCGGCKWQHLDYAAQLRFKHKQVTDALARIGGLAHVPVQPVIAADAPYFYRNKLEFTFSNRRWKSRTELQAGNPGAGDDALGFHVPGAFDKVLNITECWLQDARVNAVRNEVLHYAVAHRLPFFDLKAQTGLLRNLVFRTSRATGELLVMLILAAPDLPVIDALFTHLRAHFPFITSLLWMHNPKRNDSYSDLTPVSWYGPAFIRERLFDKWFAISPTSFFQTNTVQAERLYGVVRRMLPHAVVRLYDLYCGAGSIGISLADKAQEVLGIEYVASAVADAKANVQRNNLHGYRFEAGDIAKLLTATLVKQYGTPNVIVTDPPRAGMADAVIRQLLQLECPTIIYVSCNPATQARDLLLLSEKYDVLEVQPVDMFPQTSHVEAVAKLVLRA